MGLQKFGHERWLGYSTVMPQHLREHACQYQLKNPHSAELKIPHLAGGDGLQFQPADRSYAQSFPLEFLDLIHVSTSQQCQPSSASRIGPVAHRRRVVDFSTSIMGIFASAVTRLRAPAVW
jgi:hypothetical protein